MGEVLTEAQFNKPIKQSKGSNSIELPEEKIQYRNDYALIHRKWLLLQWKLRPELIVEIYIK